MISSGAQIETRPPSRLALTRNSFSKYINGNAIREIVFATGALCLSSAIRCLPIENTSLNYTASTVAAVAGIVLFKNVLKWWHVPIHFIVQPILFTAGIKWRIGESQEKKFKPQVYEYHKKIAGSLRYEILGGREVPVFEVGDISPYMAGVIQGKIMASQILHLLQHVFNPLITFSQLRVGDTRGTRLSSSAVKHKFPKEDLEEMRGICQGVNEYCKENNIRFELTETILKYVHSFNDIYKASGKSFLSSSIPKYIINLLMGDFGCSVGIKKSDKGLIVVRNLDWPGIELGTYAYLKREKTSDGETIETHTYPGLLSAITTLRLDAKGNISLVLIANERGEYSHDHGVPYGLWVRSCIRTCKTVDEVETFVSQHDFPASSFNFIAIDVNKAVNYQFHPSPNQLCSIRKMSHDQILIVTNHLVDPATDEAGSEVHSNPRLKRSLVRFKAIEELFRKAVSCDFSLGRSALKQTNTYWTMSSMLFEIGTPNRVYANANTYSADDLPDSL